MANADHSARLKNGRDAWNAWRKDELAAHSAWLRSQGGGRNSGKAETLANGSLVEFRAGTDSEIEAAFTSMVAQHAEALLIPNNPYLISRAQKIAGLAAGHGLPAMYGRRSFTAAGGLISYGDDISESYRQVGIYAGRILKADDKSELT